MKSSIFLGIGGSGMKGLAYLLREQGEKVIGFDDNPETSEVSLKEAIASLSDVSRLVYTDSAAADHALRKAAEALHMQQTPYQQALGEFSQGYTTIAITGTHGKSSTTAFLSHIMIEAGLDPTVLVGASMPSLPGKHARLGKSQYFIVEADEYRKHFLELSPSHIIITSIDFDHPDAFSSLQDVEHAYEEFMQSMNPDGIVVLPEHEQISHPTMTFPATVHTIPKDAISDIRVVLPGKHMRMNGALAVALAETLGVPRDMAIASLNTFPGLARRFELLGTVNGCDIRSDYGHHPAEIAATITGSREIYPTSHVIAVFEAHMPLRLHTFFSDFVEALSYADEVCLVPPFVPAGRDSMATEDIARLEQELVSKGKKTTYTDHVSDFLLHMEPGSVALLFSAGALDSLVRKTVNKV